MPTASDQVTFAVSGVGQIDGVGNGDPSDHDPDKSNKRHAFNGKCLVDVGTRENPGRVVLSASAPGLIGASLLFVAK